MNRPVAFLLFLTPILFAGIPVCSAQLKSAMVNACGTEGENEYLVLQHTQSSVIFQPKDICLWYGTSMPATTPVCDSICSTPNDGYTAALNQKLDSACSFRFKSLRPGDSIRQNDYLLIRYHTPTDTPNFSSWCQAASDTIHVVFACGNKWKSGGNFANSPTSWRYFRLKYGADSSDYRYTNGWSTTRDGNYVIFDSSGMSPSYANYPGCDANTAQALPVELLSFRAERLGTLIHLRWETAAEWNNYGFVPERSSDGMDWQARGFVSGAGYAATVNYYSFEDSAQELLPYYYRLRELDQDGKSEVIASIHVPYSGKSGIKVFPNPFWNSLELCGIPDWNRVLSTDGFFRFTDVRGNPVPVNWLREGNCIRLFTDHIAEGMYLLGTDTQSGFRYWIVHKHRN